MSHCPNSGPAPNQFMLGSLLGRKKLPTVCDRADESSCCCPLLLLLVRSLATAASHTLPSCLFCVSCLFLFSAIKGPNAVNYCAHASLVWSSLSCCCPLLAGFSSSLVAIFPVLSSSCLLSCCGRAVYVAFQGRG